MNEQLQQQIVAYLQTFAAGLEKAKDFSAEQAPLVVQEFLTWEIGSNLVELLIGIILISLCCYGVRGCFKFYQDTCELCKTRDGHCFNDEECFRTAIAAFVGVALSILVISYTGSLRCYTLAALKAYTAPRIVVIEKISELTKGGKVNDNKLMNAIFNQGQAEMVTITKKEYDELIKDQNWLRCLEAAGVDNWNGFEYAIEIRKREE